MTATKCNILCWTSKKDATKKGRIFVQFVFEFHNTNCLRSLRRFAGLYHPLTVALLYIIYEIHFITFGADRYQDMIFFILKIKTNLYKNFI
ncbi:hypothetical protein BpHYR1_008742 [Brachionus plicatilis]|uniref:Uncharacterized protein n=1 Tax=Brachionus plicatilis TaxID=10195 RepID=A0A3M7RV01_BRAPC|nr:hypothetical protein BpHYR1_008742 [Brachionus plicatilis]